ncbi:hypothetical protein QQF64_005597 [Cirrhinus molitorella]|uniref:Uncharacterized protein n=1 Tax=Cirrhinus molitorella TaxID=172907 RepID=A0ABR3MCL7_9TELE
MEKGDQIERLLSPSLQLCSLWRLKEGGQSGCPSSRANLPATGQIPQHGSHRSQLETFLQSGPTGLKGEGNQKQMGSTLV